jgi:hypothetical protein
MSFENSTLVMEKQKSLLKVMKLQFLDYLQSESSKVRRLDYVGDIILGCL